MRDYQPLPEVRLGSASACVLPESHAPAKVTARSPAIEVMTDLRRVPAATIGADVPVGEAHQAMIVRGVRLLFVTAAEARRVVGMITTHDLLGEKPLQVGRSRGVRFDEVRVRDIMVAAEDTEAIELDDVLRAEVGHVVATLKQRGRQHALVVERAGGDTLIRGIFSASQIARQLGVPIQTPEVARTFAEIEAALAPS